MANKPECHCIIGAFSRPTLVNKKMEDCEVHGKNAPEYVKWWRQYIAKGAYAAGQTPVSEVAADPPDEEGEGRPKTCGSNLSPVDEDDVARGSEGQMTKKQKIYFAAIALGLATALLRRHWFWWVGVPIDVVGGMALGWWAAGQTSTTRSR